MLRILDKNKVPVKGLRKYSDLCIENSIELDDKTLTFSVPYRNVRSAIVVEGYIETKEDRFVVKEIEKSSEGTANITAQLDLESLEGKPFRTFRSEEQTIKAALQLAFTGTGWTVGECSVSKKRTLSMANVSALDVLKQALKTYRAEIKIDSKKQSIDIYPEIGSDKGVYFSDQLNLRKLTVQYSTYDFYTEIEPYGKDGLTIETVNSGKIYLENHQYSSKKKRCIWKDERYTIADSLKEDAAAKLADMSKPYVSYSADIVDLSRNSQKYSILQYEIGDTVTLIDQAKIDGLSSTISQTYATGSDVQQKLASADATAKGYADAAKQAAVDTAQASAKELLKSYATVTQTQSMIDQKAGSIESKVSSTYATKKSVGELQTWKTEASQKITDSAIVSTVTSSTEWTKKADKASLISQINQSAEQIKIRANIIDLQGNISITDISNDAMDTIKNYSITALSDAKKYTDECDKLVIKDSQDYSKSYTLSEIGKLEASGGNLVKGYRFSDDNIKAYWNTAGTIKSGQNDPDGGKNAVAIVADAANCYLASKRNENTIINATGRYTVTFWAKASKAQTVTFSFNKVSESIALTTTWKKFSFIKDITSIATSGSLIIFGGSNSISTGDGTIYIYRPDVRHGYSSEDIFNLLTNNGNIQGMYMTDGKLYWNGTYIKSKSITTAALAADSVTAEKIKVDDLYSLKASIAGFKISSDTISHQSITNPESGIGQNYYDTFFSSKDKRLTFRKGPGTSDYITFDIRGLRASGGKRLNLISDAETNDSSEGFSSGAHHSMGHTNIYGNLYVADSFRTAGTKQAVRQTENYGEKGVYCYETPTPHFGDIGSGEISEDGKCYIDIEDILKEMINTEMQYYVFLQKCGEGDLYVSECFPDYFIVTGTPGLRFFWELKAKQKGYEYNRYEGEDRVVGFRKIAYDEEYIAETEKLIEEREEI